MNLMWLVRMARWVRHPPSMRQLYIVLTVVAVVVVIVTLEWAGLWPDWAQMERPRGTVSVPHLK